MPRDDLIRVAAEGLYCPAGGFHIDPWRPVDRAVLTHAHGDHARAGSGAYLVTAEGEPVFRRRLGDAARLETAAYGDARRFGDVRVSLHPAGHILGSAQVRVEHRGEVWVVSGDYKTGPDPTCTPFEPVRCHTFITECTFGLPIYRWPDPAEVLADINAWWRANADAGRNSLLFAYALGKAQRVLAGVDPAIGPVLTHGAVEGLNEAYRAAGIALPPTEHAAAGAAREAHGALVIAPPSAAGTPWARRFGAAATAFASGWMTLRGTRRRRAVDRGFVLSDHVDWPALLEAIDATGAGRVLATHGHTDALVRWLREKGLEADRLATPYASTGEEEEGDAKEAAADA
jgi:putative mRNA 3-end processing factor